MKFLWLTVLLIPFLIIQEFQSIDGSIEQIYGKVKEWVEDLIDSQDYESVEGILKDSKVKVKYFDYYVPTSAKPTSLTTTTQPSVKGNSMTRDASNAAGAVDDKHDSEKEAGGGPIVYGAIAGVVVLVVIGAAIGVFLYIRQTKTDKNKNIRGKKPKRNASVESLASIVTVASDTGKPVNKAKGAAGAAKSAVAKKK